jgi:hypothetical protein
VFENVLTDHQQELHDLVGGRKATLFTGLQSELCVGVHVAFERHSESFAVPHISQRLSNMREMPTESTVGLQT